MQVIPSGNSKDLKQWLHMVFECPDDSYTAFSEEASRKDGSRWDTEALGGQVGWIERFPRLNNGGDSGGGFQGAVRLYVTDTDNQTRQLTYRNSCPEMVDRREPSVAARRNVKLSRSLEYCQKMGGDNEEDDDEEEEEGGPAGRRSPRDLRNGGGGGQCRVIVNGDTGLANHHTAMRYHWQGRSKPEVLIDLSDSNQSEVSSLDNCKDITKLDDLTRPDSVKLPSDKPQYHVQFFDQFDQIVSDVRTHKTS